MAKHNKIGQQGEKISVNYLREKGYKILKTNWTHNRKEIDIIVKKNDILSIVEVKTRTSETNILPSETVNFQKQKFLINAANNFVNIYNINLEIRFDIIIVTLKTDSHKIEHIKDAFYPMVE